MPSSPLSFFCSNSFLTCSSRLFNAENERESVVVVDSGMPDSSWCPGGGTEEGAKERKEGVRERKEGVRGRREGVRKERRKGSEEGKEERKEGGRVNNKQVENYAI